MSETEQDAYIAASQEYRDAQQTRIALFDAAINAERVEMNVSMGVNSSAVLVSAARGFLATIRVALEEATEAERIAGDKAAQEYNALQATNRGWGTSLKDLEELRTSE